MKALLLIDMQNVCVALTAFGAVKNGFKVALREAAIGTMFTKQKDKLYKKPEKQGARFV